MTKDYDPSPWFPETNALRLAALGKALEEIFELLPLLDFSPPRGRSVDTDYYRHLSEELADVQATLTVLIRRFELKEVDFWNDLEKRSELALRKLLFANLGKAISRVIIQGIDESEPRTGESNRDILSLLVSQALCSIRILISTISVFSPEETEFIKERTERKIAYLTKWHENMSEENA